MGILRRTEKAMVRAMCGAEFTDKKNTEDKMMGMLRLNQAIHKMAKANEVRWLGHVLRKEDVDVVRNALKLHVEGRRKRGRPKRI